MEAGTEVVKGDKDVVEAPGTIPKWLFGGDEVDNGRQEGVGVNNT